MSTPVWIKKMQSFNPVRSGEGGGAYAPPPNFAPMDLFLELHEVVNIKRRISRI